MKCVRCDQPFWRHLPFLQCPRWARRWKMEWGCMCGSDHAHCELVYAGRQACCCLPEPRPRNRVPLFDQAEFDAAYALAEREGRTIPNGTYGGSTFYRCYFTNFPVPTEGTK